MELEHPLPCRKTFWRSSLYLLGKQGETLEDCQDAGLVRGDLCRAAVSDGATEAYMSGLWARTLSKHACLSGPPTGDSLVQWLEAPQEEFRNVRLDLIKDPTKPFFMKEPLSRLGAATLVSLEIKWNPDSSGFFWHASVVGDSCLFHLRPGVALGVFPIAVPENFDSYPICLPSGESPKPLPEVQEFHGTALVGDEFMLATDAFSHWLVTERAWSLAREIRDDEAFIHLVKTEREAGRMKNDDVCLLSIRLFKPVSDLKAATPSPDSGNLDALTRLPDMDVPKLQTGTEVSISPKARLLDARGRGANIVEMLKTPWGSIVGALILLLLMWLVFAGVKHFVK